MQYGLLTPGLFDPDPRIQPLPKAYETEAEERGTLHHITYRIGDGTDKDALVYTPFGYDAARPDDIFYMMHGGGGNYHTCLGDPDGIFRRLLDHLIMEKRLRPILVVTPTFYPADDTDTSPEHSGELVRDVPDELIRYLMPAVESRFSTYAGTADREGFQASRAHRAFGGFSMGSVTTWEVFMHCLNCFSVFLPMSGDSWVKGRLGGGTDPEGTAEAITKAVQAQGAHEFFICAMTGSNDIAYPNLKPQMLALAKRTETFISDPDAEGNLRFSVREGAYHCYEAIWEDLYFALPLLWPVKA